MKAIDTLRKGNGCSDTVVEKMFHALHMKCSLKQCE